MPKSNHPNLAPVVILVLIVVVGVGGWYFFSGNNHKKNPTASPATTAPAPATTGPTSTSPSTPGSYNVVANKIIGPNGQQFVPYGFVVECMAKTVPINELCQVDGGNSNTGTQVVEAASTFWHANVLRFQVAQESLFSGPGGSVDQTYLNLVDSMVKQANSEGMVAIVTLQEEEHNKNQYLPEASSVKFWQFMANNFKNDPDVFYDIYNEPRLTTKEAGSESTVWNDWKNGGTVDGVTYVGMQTMVNTIRGTGANNVIVAESNNFDTDLTQIRTHLLTGSNITYGFEPGIKGKDSNPAAWNAAFGQYAGQIPLMPEAFIQYIGGHGCNDDAPTVLPQLLNYLKQNNIGIIVFSLESGVTFMGSSPTSPTSYDGQSSISCPTFNGVEKPIQGTTVGDGQTILNYFKTYSSNSQ